MRYVTDDFTNFIIAAVHLILSLSFGIWVMCWMTTWMMMII